MNLQELRRLCPVGLGRRGTLWYNGMVGRQAAGAALGTRTEADFVLFPQGSPERAILDIQRAANPLIARYVLAGR